ncbi:hypothetical protein HPB48_014386 [Haemaphysalis longicornis]|uniref:Uncharacterized protein n=1 Tax=Haemaphysalis longicornis TaxID=44386 RepID=A0A9J6GBG8_HAELO|nr:hypothetical protein HPB48_014386 [Haemaphysalis longicornis]
MLKCLKNHRESRQAYVIRWGQSKEALLQTSLGESHGGKHISVAIIDGMHAVTETYSLKADSPNPDIHLHNLWASRLQAQERYRKNSKTLELWIKLNKATAATHRYSKKLQRAPWHPHCSSFN